MNVGIWRNKLLVVFSTGDLFTFGKKGFKERKSWVVTSGHMQTRGLHHKHVMMTHRIIMEAHLGRELRDDEFINHIDHNPLNNCIDNLEIVTRAQNKQWSRPNKTNVTGYKGVSWKKRQNKWESQIGVDGRKIHLGHFDTPEEAYEAYKTKARELNALGHKYYIPPE